MKRIYIYFFLTFLYTIGYAQNADFDLSLKLNTQSNRYYFEVVLTNTSSDATYTFNRSSDSCLGGYPHACILVPELEYKDGSMHEGLDLGFFYFTHEGKKELKILPGESYSCNIAYLCEQQIMGMLRRSDLGNVKQIRVRLKKFKALKTGNKYFDVIDTQGNDVETATVLIAATSTSPYEKTISAKYALTKDKSEIGSLSLKLEDKTSYKNLVVTNSYNENKCLKLTWNPEELVIDLEDATIIQNKNENDYTNELIFSLEKKNSKNFIFYQLDNTKTINEENFTLVESTECN